MTSPPTCSPCAGPVGREHRSRSASSGRSSAPRPASPTQSLPFTSRIAGSSSHAACRPAKLTVVMNTLDESLLPQDSAPREERAFRIVYHGTVTPLYGVPLLVEACALIADLVPNFRLEIYGEGDSVATVRRPRDRARDRRPSAGQRGVSPPPRRAPQGLGCKCRRRAEPSNADEPIRALVQALRIRRLGDPRRLL